MRYGCHELTKRFDERSEGIRSNIKDSVLAIGIVEPVLGASPIEDRRTVNRM